MHKLRLYLNVKKNKKTKEKKTKKKKKGIKTWFDISCIYTITPVAVHQEETLSTLKFATSAKNIKNINKVVGEATILQKYKDEIHTIKATISTKGTYILFRIL